MIRKNIEATWNLDYKIANILILYNPYNDKLLNEI